jgi:hypothetical protein
VEITPPTTDLSTSYLAPFLGLTGDRRTAAPLAATVRGIVAIESLVCAHRGVFPVRWRRGGIASDASGACCTARRPPAPRSILTP